MDDKKRNNKKVKNEKTTKKEVLGRTVSLNRESHTWPL